MTSLIDMQAPLVDIPDDADSSELLRNFFAEFLDIDQYEEFRRLELLIQSLLTAGDTHSGQPLIRPRDCNAITQGLAGIFEAAKPRFRMGDSRVVDRFERMIRQFTERCAKVYPSEASAALVLHGQVLLFLGRHQQALDVVGEWVERPYALESAGHILSLAELYGQAHLRLGLEPKVQISYIALGQWVLANSRAHSAFDLGPRLAPYVALEKKPQGGMNPRAWLTRFASRQLLAHARIHGAVPRMVYSFLWWHLCRLVLVLCYGATTRTVGRRSPYSLRMSRGGGALVSRAMGGIGDLLMMTPGLEALAARQKHPVDFVIPRKFHAIFKGNPHIRLIDSHGPALDIASYRRFINLTYCPASIYEGRARPFIRKGRVETFARGMGIKAAALRRQGWAINRVELADDKAFCESFLQSKGFGQRKLIGVAPYSRDSYKDYPQIETVIERLVQDYDVLIFHHVSAGLPSGAGIASTAGLSLEKSLALVARLDAMVSVDSAFLHAAAAYNYPVIGLFGPTDGKPLTRHHRRPIVLAKQGNFACVPCWRNEDSPCALTELRAGSSNGTMWSGPSGANLVAAYSISACMAALEPDEIIAQVAAALGHGAA